MGERQQAVQRGVHKRRAPFPGRAHRHCPGLPSARPQAWGPRWDRRSIWQRPHIPEALTYASHYVSFKQSQSRKQRAPASLPPAPVPSPPTCNAWYCCRSCNCLVTSKIMLHRGCFGVKTIKHSRPVTSSYLRACLSISVSYLVRNLSKLSGQDLSLPSRPALRICVSKLPPPQEPSAPLLLRLINKQEQEAPGRDSHQQGEAGLLGGQRDAFCTWPLGPCAPPALSLPWSVSLSCVFH